MKHSSPLWSLKRSGNLDPERQRSAIALENLARQLEESQWWTSAKLAEAQAQQLKKLAEHAEKHSPLFRRRLAQSGLSARELTSVKSLFRLPVLHRRELQSAGNDAYCGEVPQNHLPVTETRTSGSTGEPVAVKKTALNNLFWHALTLREYFWHERDFSGRMTVIRPTVAACVMRETWGPPVDLLFKTGPLQAIPVTTDIAQMIASMLQFQPHELLVMPNILQGIVEHCEHYKSRFADLQRIKTVGETLSPELRARTEATLGIKITDSYSSQELGPIAVQCPNSELMHVMSESLVVEVLKENGEACRPREFGRVVVTDLHNFATPLVRYDIGDFAEVGGACPCRRGLATLRRVLGRERNLILMPDGTRHYPLVGFAKFRDVAPVVQYQLIQDGRETIEVRLVTERPLRAQEESALRSVIQRALGFPFELHFTYFKRQIPRQPSGKFEEFVCKIGA